MAATADVEHLRARLERFPPQRFPTQHATLALALATELANQGRFQEAEPLLRRAGELFGSRLPLERARCENVRGAVLRGQGRPQEAAEAFTSAVAGFAQAGEGLDEGAARFNLGLTLREAGRGRESLTELERAHELLQSTPGAHLAARERAAGLLLLERPEEALDLLAEAEGGLGEDPVEEGAVANLIGLARLALGQHERAAAAFRRAAAANPAALRPAAHAMAKANLGLALEHLGDVSRARLAAAQALVIREAEAAVSEQARMVLERLGSPLGDLAAVLTADPADAAAVREELHRWLALDKEAAAGEAHAFASGMLTASDPVAALETWVGGLLELPPDPLRRLLHRVMEGLSDLEEADIERVRRLLGQALARFHVPQWERLSAMLSEAAAEADVGGRWG